MVRLPGSPGSRTILCSVSASGDPLGEAEDEQDDAHGGGDVHHGVEAEDDGEESEESDDDERRLEGHDFLFLFVPVDVLPQYHAW